MSLQLEHLIYSNCPTCGAVPISIKKKDRHTNGHWNEDITFECGCSIHYSPNYRAEQVTSECRNTEEYKKQKAQNKEALKKVKTCITTLKCSEQFKACLKDKLELASYLT